MMGCSMNIPLKLTLVAISQIVLSIPYATAAFSATPADGYIGKWLTEDAESIVSIKPCENRPSELCGYLIGFPETGNGSMNKALCGIRILGGLKPRDGNLEEGWFFDIETSNAYDLKLTSQKSGTAISLRVYEGVSVLGETFVWTRHKVSSVSPSEKFCD
jgi:uncharacterized protein (DUF2147 family)